MSKIENEKASPLLLKQIEAAIAEVDQSPLYGQPPPFPWEPLTEGLKVMLNLSTLQFKEEGGEWHSAEEADELLEKKGLYSIFLPDLDQSAWLELPPSLIRALSISLVGGEMEASHLEDAGLTEGLIRFILAEGLRLATQGGFGGGLGLQLEDQATPPNQPTFIKEIRIFLPSGSHLLRLGMSKDLLKKWQECFQEERKMEGPLLDTLALHVGVAIGEVALSPEEWGRVREGDLLLLDHCGVDPKTREGGAELTLEGSSFFSGRLNRKGFTLGRSEQEE